jgi:putative hydrolase
MSSNLPFGFGSGDRDPNRPNSEGFDDLASKIPLFAELQKLMSWTGGPVNWDLARQIAISTVAADHRDPTPKERAEVSEALRLADLWLDDATDLPSGVVTIESWSRVDWIERTLPVWATLCDPIAARVVDAMGSALPEEVRAQAGPLGAVMNQFGGMMFGAQVGQGIGALAQEIVSSTDVGLPLAATGLAALLPQNVTAFGEGLERPQDEVRLYLALREAAHQRLYAHVGWLRQRVIDTIESYARGIRVDPSAIERAMSEIDPTNPESMQNALAGGMFEPDDTPEQAAALRRLEVLLALIEGWVDAVVQAAAGERMPGADALREASRRRRATGGPAEQTFSTLVGLQLRPRRLRDAAALWWAVTERRGVSGRDAIWAHPDLLPTAEDLDDPIGFAEPPDDSDPMTELRSEDADDPDANDPGSDDRGDGQRS